MPNIADMLRPRCQKHPEFEQEDCLICTKETPQERDARMEAFYKRFPRLVAAAERHGVPGYRSEAEMGNEGIEDDD